MTEPRPDAIPDLDPELRSLLDAERHGERPPAAAQGRVWASLTVALPTLPTVPTPPSHAPTTGLGAQHAWRALAVKGALVATGFGVGTGTGAVLHARYAHPAVSTTAAAPGSVPAPPAPAQPPPAPEPAIAPAPEPLRPGRRAPTPAAHVTPAPTGGDAALAEERRLLDRARSALEHGDGAAALAALEEHAKGYPRGRLLEEAGALRIQALIRQDRPSEARAAAAAFHARYPNSLLGPAVDAALQPR